jgi:hypothetical protein
MAALVGLTVADPAAAWSDLGFVVVGSSCQLGQVRVELGGQGEGVTAWTLTGVDAPDGRLDGLATSVLAGSDRVPPAAHQNGAQLIDHVVVMTPDLERTVGVFQEAGLLLRRRRDAGATYGTELRQAFFRAGEVILEVVGPVTPESSGPAVFRARRYGR